VLQINLVLIQLKIWGSRKGVTLAKEEAVLENFIPLIKETINQSIPAKSAKCRGFQVCFILEFLILSRANNTGFLRLYIVQ
jgi:hypothetical protein